MSFASRFSFPALIGSFLLASTFAFQQSVLAKNPQSVTSPRPSSFSSSSPSAASYAAGDQAFFQRQVPEQGRLALSLFREYHERNPKDPAAAWRRSMACYFNGLHLTAVEEEQKRLFTEGRDAGNEGVKLDPRCAPCHFWKAINMALYGQKVGVFKMYFTLGEIREHLQKTAELEPGFAGAGAYRLLGLIQQKLPGILGGSDDEAKRFYKLAINTAPDEPLNYLFLVKLLRDQKDDLPGALEVARKALVTLPKPSPEQLEALSSLKELETFVTEHPGSGQN